MPTFVVGDVHGERDALAELLRRAGLIDGAETWIGADARLWLMGDLVDRGPDGIGTIELVMSLQRDADVRCLLGNHEVMLLAADACGWSRLPGSDLTLAELWELNGGRVSDLRRLSDAQRAWLRVLPPVAVEGEWLLVHADTVRYVELGRSVAEIGERVAITLAAPEPGPIAALLDVVCDRGLARSDADVTELLSTLGGRRVVHGHTPIALVTGRDPRSVTAPLVSADSRVVDVDHCLYAGGPGFVFELP